MLNYNEVLTYNDMQDLVNDEGYKSKKSIPSSNECVSKEELEEYLFVYISSGVDNNLPAYSELSKGLYLEPYGTIAYTGTTFYLDVDSATPWSVESDQSWLQVSEYPPTTEADQVKLVAQVNYLTSTRTATVTLTNSGGETYSVVLTQAANPGIDTDPVTIGVGVSESSACSAYLSGPTIKYVPEGETFTNTGQLYNNSAGTVPASSGYYSDGTGVRYWNGSTFTTSGLCI